MRSYIICVLLLAGLGSADGTGVARATQSANHRPRAAQLEASRAPQALSVAEVLPSPTGPYQIGRMSFHWKDNEREELETKAPGDKRELMVHLFYPRDATATGERAVYLPDADALRREWSDAQFRRIRAMQSFSLGNAPLPVGTARYPVVIFSPGGGSKVLTYQALIEDLASHGWVVAAIDPPFNTLAVRFPDGRVLGNLPPAEQTWPDDQLNTYAYNQRIMQWSRDVSFVIDQLSALDNGSGPFARRLDLKRGVGAFGHSFGGTTAGTVRLLDTRVRSSINLDGVGGGAYILAKGPNVGGAQPLLWVLVEPIDHISPQAYRTLPLVTGGALRVFLNRPGFRHEDFSDEPFWNGSMTPDKRTAKFDGVSEVREWVRTFFDATVRGDWAGLKRLSSRTSAATPNTVTAFGPFWSSGR